MIWVGVDPQREVWTRTRKNTRISSIDSVSYVTCPSLSLLSFLLYESFSSFSSFVPVHLDYFWSYRVLLFMAFHHEQRLLRYSSLFKCSPGQLLILSLFFCRIFVMNKDFWGFSYYLGLSFCIECGDVRQVTYIDAEAVMESPRTFRRLPWRSLAFLQLISIARIYLRGDLSVLPRWMLDLIEDSRFYVD